MGKFGMFAQWADGLGSFVAKRSAQSFLTGTQVAFAAASACGSGDTEKTPAACGTACGAGDDGKKKPEEKPAAACGAGDDGKAKPEKKPAACGSACGAGDK